MCVLTCGRGRGKYVNAAQVGAGHGNGFSDSRRRTCPVLHAGKGLSLGHADHAPATAAADDVAISAATTTGPSVHAGAPEAAVSANPKDHSTADTQGEQSPLCAAG